uniref:Uncharacterized protein n=1 Tax=Leersia perrieri TaxID=77586 RepID=A0A0D9X5U6_9ORYZ
MGAAGSSGSHICASPIHAFRTDGVGKCEIYCAARWLCSLSRRSILNLTLSLPGPTLLSWNALIRLHLERCHMTRAPHGFSGFFPSLLSPVLDHVALPFMAGGAQLECLIAATPRLAVLNLSFILDIILVRIPIKPLARTCSLSGAWRHRRRVLWLCISPIRDDGVGKCGIYCAARWLYSLSRRSILNLTLSLPGPTLLSWNALIHLHLERCHMTHAPHIFSGFFPSLLSLVLDHVALPFLAGGAQLE